MPRARGLAHHCVLGGLRAHQMAVAAAQQDVEVHGSKQRQSYPPRHRPPHPNARGPSHRVRVCVSSYTPSTLVGMRAACMAANASPRVLFPPTRLPRVVLGSQSSIRRTLLQARSLFAPPRSLRAPPRPPPTGGDECIASTACRGRCEAAADILYHPLLPSPPPRPA